jgi:hypothetical protein
LWVCIETGAPELVLSTVSLKPTMILNIKSPLAWLTMLALSSGALYSQENLLPVSRTSALLTTSLPKGKTTLLALPTVTVVASGTVSAVSGNDLTLTSSPAVLPALAGPHAIKITSRVDQSGSGSNAPAGTSANAYGLSAKITNAAGQVVTAALTAAPNVGDEFVIYPISTLSSIFGATNSAGLTPGANSAEADIVYLGSGGTLVGYFYNSADSHWRLASDPSGANQDTAEIAPGAAVMALRRSTGSGVDPVSLPMSGSVLPGKQITSVSAGFQVVNNPFTVGTTLAASGLHNQINGGTSAAGADLLYLEDAGVLTAYYYKVGGLGGSGWRTPADGVTNQGGVVIAPGKAILFKEQAGAVGFAFQEPFAE